MSFLSSIAKYKAEEIMTRKQQRLRKLEAELVPSKLLVFLRALATNNKDVRMISEMKRLSPSKGQFRRLLKVSQVTGLFGLNEVVCWSVLTDQRLFGGDNSHLRCLRERCCIPILRKDFTVTRCQVLEAFVFGADAILVVTSTLSQKKANSINNFARNLGLSVVVETNSPKELSVALGLGAFVIGINNRSINTFKIGLGGTVKLAKQVPSGHLVLVESGITTANDIRWFTNFGMNCFLIGEFFMRRESA